MLRFIGGVIALTGDLLRAVGRELWHERSCAMKTDDVPHRCTCKRNKDPKLWVCNRCGHRQHSSAQCGNCGWGDLYNFYTGRQPAKQFRFGVDYNGSPVDPAFRPRTEPWVCSSCRHGHHWDCKRTVGGDSCSCRCSDFYDDWRK